MLETQYLIPVLAFVAVFAVGAGLLLARAVRRKSLNERLAADSDRLGIDADAGEGQLRTLTSRLGASMGVSGSSSNLRKVMARAGYNTEKDVTTFFGAKVIFLVVAIIVTTLLTLPMPWSTPMKVLLIISVAGLAFWIPNLWVRIKGSSREQQIRRSLPDAVDLLEICVSGGMGLDQAWNVVTDEIASVSMLLSDEMAKTNLEIHLGASRSQAMRHMGERTGCQEASSLAAALTQSEHFGTSIGETLRVFAGSMREQRSHQAAETAEKLAVKLLFPLIFLIFPAIFVVVVGPTLIELLKIMGSK